MLSHEEEINLLQDIDAAFSRKYTFRAVPVEDSVRFLNSVESHGELIWNDAELHRLKNRLNDVKSLLSDIDIVPWSAHTSNTHRAGRVREFMRRQFRAELCTQAWCKFYEIISSFPDIVNIIPLLRDQSCKDFELKDERKEILMNRFNSLHLCEAPGAFVASLNHYLVSHGYDTSKWHWLASTLNPYYEGNSLSSMINDDSFIRDMLDHWIFGEDNTGNIMSERNLKAIQLSCKEKDLWPIHLITADGSVDCADDPAEQESIVSCLHFHEVLTALHLLAPGGSFVLKMFTLFESISICIIHLLRCLFEKVHVMKPVTSKPGNSEVYIVSTAFKGASSSLLSDLSKFIYTSNLSQHVPFPCPAIPELFIEEHRECCRRFTDWQMTTIKQNIETFQKLAFEECEKLEVIKDRFVEAFLERFPVVELNRSDRVVPISSAASRQYRVIMNPTESEKPAETCRLKVNSKTRSKWVRVHRCRHAGTFIERKQVKNQTWQEKLTQMKLFNTDTVQHISTWSEQQPDCDVGEGCIEKEENWIDITRGQALSEICSSKFCEHDLLQHYRMFMKNVSTDLCAHSALSAKHAQQLFEESEPGAVVTTILSYDELCTASRSCIEAAGQLLVYNDLSDQLLHSAVCVLDGRDLINLLNILQVLPAGCHLVLSTHVVLTRLSAAALRLLCLLFCKVTTIKRGESCRWYIVAVGYKGSITLDDCDFKKLSKILCSDIDSQLQCSQEAFKTDGSDSSLHYRVLSVLSMRRLCECRFLNFIRKNNDDFMILRMNTLLRQLKPSISF